MGFCNGVAGAAGAVLFSIAVVAPGAASAASAKEAINGVWMAQTPYRIMNQLQPPPELTPTAAAARQKLLDAQAKGYTRAVSNMLCQGVGGPSQFQGGSPFNIFSGFGRILFVFETEWTNQPRTVYLNEKVQPPNIFPSYNGHSIGHWEGETLVVDTVGYNGRQSHRGNWFGGIPRSEDAHTIEKFSLSPDGKVMTLEITTIDPKTFVKPWTTTVKFDRQPDTDERFEVTCEVDLDAYNAQDLKALSEVDPEVKRLFDPDLRESDPALRIAAPKK